jgi:hypothetical protein
VFPRELFYLCRNFLFYLAGNGGATEQLSASA